MFSVIIPAKNEAENIRRCVRSVFHSLTSDIDVEVIVVDNGSTDGTVEIAKSEGATVLVEKQSNISGLRNLGASKASYNLIGFIDADCEAYPNWLESGRNILLSDSSIGIVGDYYTLPENPGWIERALFSSIPRKRRDVPYLSGGNMIMRKEVFMQVNGFDVGNITGEDYILCQKIKAAGYRVIADPSVIVVHHGNSKTLGQWFRREVWCGLGMFDLYKNGKLSLPLIWACINSVLLAGLTITLITGQNVAFFFLIAILFILPIGADIVYCQKCKNFNFFFPLYIIFMVYGSARTIALIKLTLNRSLLSGK